MDRTLSFVYSKILQFPAMTVDTASWIISRYLNHLKVILQHSLVWFGFLGTCWGLLQKNFCVHCGYTLAHKKVVMEIRLRLGFSEYSESNI